MKKREVPFLMAAVAGITMAGTGWAGAPAGEKTEVRCWGVNSCEGKGAVTEADLKAFKTLFGEKEYAARYGKSEAHDCAAHGKCGSKEKILSWEVTTAGDCKARGGYVVEDIGPEKKKVARKA
jgi:hypothetical protein